MEKKKEIKKTIKKTTKKVIKKTTAHNSTVKKKKGFTLIELLAVIIILGILLIIAIPSVTRYISDSRKNSYIDTAKQVIGATRNLVNSGDLEMYDTNMTYYIPNSCLKVENGNVAKSPYGDFIKDKTYVVVTYDGNGYDYYWVSLDDTGIGIKDLTSIDELDIDIIETDLKEEDINTNIGIGERNKVMIFNADCTGNIVNDAVQQFSLILDANGGRFSDGKENRTVKYTQGYGFATKYSYTSNINSKGVKISDYGTNWTNAYIVGSDRGDIRKAHVVTIPGATSLHVTITYGGANAYADYVCMFKGSYPDYNAYDNCISSYTGRLGGGNHLDASNTKEYNISGDTVTFLYKSDNFDAGDGYGYYAKIEGQGETLLSSNNFEAPTKSGYSLWWWKSSKTGAVYSNEEVSRMDPNQNDTLVAIWSELDKPLCVRATSLHQEICRNNGDYCGRLYANGDLITYGNDSVTQGVLKSGDAFDCDVNNDGEYDPIGERFYYVSDYYDASTNSFNNEYAALLYYTNYKSSNWYNAEKNNYLGPNIAYQYLPSTSEWSNVSLFKSTRNIVNENGENSSNNGEFTTGTFTYEGKAARLLTYQEINSGCYYNREIRYQDSLNKCVYLFENTSFAYMNRTYSYWMENPQASSDRFIWFPSASGRQLGGLNADAGDSCGGTRPVIDVKKTRIQY